MCFEEPSAGNLHAGVSEGEVAGLPWQSYSGMQLETADTDKARLPRASGLLYSEGVYVIAMDGPSGSECTGIDISDPLYLSPWCKQ